MICNPSYDTVTSSKLCDLQDTKLELVEIPGIHKLCCHFLVVLIELCPDGLQFLGGHRQLMAEPLILLRGMTGVGVGEL